MAVFMEVIKNLLPLFHPPQHQMEGKLQVDPFFHNLPASQHTLSPHHQKYSSKIKKDILCTVSNTSIYCSSHKVHTVYLVQYKLCNSCKDMEYCWLVQGNSSILEIVRT
jgi:hypothetical protein